MLRLRLVAGIPEDAAEADQMPLWVTHGTDRRGVVHRFAVGVDPARFPRPRVAGDHLAIEEGDRVQGEPADHAVGEFLWHAAEDRLRGFRDADEAPSRGDLEQHVGEFAADHHHPALKEADAGVSSGGTADRHQRSEPCDREARSGSRRTHRPVAEEPSGGAPKQHSQRNALPMAAGV